MQHVAAAVQGSFGALAAPFTLYVSKDRQHKHKAFEAFLRAKAAEYAELRSKRVELRGGVESDNESDYTIIEEEEREMLETTEEVIDDGEEIEIGDD